MLFDVSLKIEIVALLYQDGKIQDIPITFTPGAEEQWTR